MKENQIINYEEHFPKENNYKKDLKRSKLPYIIVLIIYGSFLLFNLLSSVIDTKTVENKDFKIGFDILEIYDEKYLLILSQEEFSYNSSYLKDLNTYLFFHEGEIFYAISKNNNLNTIDYKKLLDDGNIDDIYIVYNNNLEVSKYFNNNFKETSLFLNYTVLVFAQLVIFIIILTPIFILLFKDLKQDSLIFFKDKEFNGWQRFGKGILPLFLISIVVGGITNLIGILLGMETNSENQVLIERLFTSNAKFIMVFIVVVIAPILEELVFRKAFFKMFNNKNLALIVSASTFALIHLITESVDLFVLGFTFKGLITLILKSLPYISMGIFFSWFYKENEENITIPILLHAAINFVGAIGILFN